MSSANSLPKPGDHVGAIDAGSNAIRFTVYQLDQNLKPVPVVQKRYPVRLGSGTFTTGLLAEPDIVAAIEVFRSISALANSHNVIALPAVATSAVREAHNSNDFLARVKDETGIKLQSISGEEEAALAAAGAAGTVHDSRDRVIVDVGGGSTEIIRCKPDGSVISNISLPLGAVRLAHQVDTPEQFTTEFFQKYYSVVRYLLITIEGKKTHIPDTLDELIHPAASRQSECGILVGGTAHALARLAVQQNLQNSADQLSLSALIRCQEVLTGATLADLAAMQIDASRAGIILPGAVILMIMMSYCKLSVATVSNFGVREGLVLKWLANPE